MKKHDYTNTFDHDESEFDQIINRGAEKQAQGCLVIAALIAVAVILTALFYVRSLFVA